MATAEWDIPFEVVTPYAAVAGSNLLINQDLGGGRQFRLNPSKCISRRSVRATVDPVPQGDGDIFHERYATGYEMQLAIQLWEKWGLDGHIACDEVLCEMRDLLYGHLWSLLRPAGDGGRVIWDPSCGDRRMLHALRLFSLQDPELGDMGVFEVTSTVDSPFPYAIAETQDTTSIATFASAIVPNAGNVEMWPVFKVYSTGTPCGAFTLESDIVDPLTGLNLLIEFDSSFGGTAIGAGEYAEIDTYKGTIFLNGDEDDLSASLVATASDFFAIQAGGTSVDFTAAGGGSSVDVLSNDAFA